MISSRMRADVACMSVNKEAEASEFLLFIELDIPVYFSVALDFRVFLTADVGNKLVMR